MNNKLIVIFSALAVLLGGVGYLIGLQVGRSQGQAEALALFSVRTPAPAPEVAPAPKPEPAPVPVLVVAEPEPEPELPPPPPPPSPYHTVRALVIGTNRGGPSQPELLFAEENARQISALLAAKLNFEVTTLIGPEATLANINQALETTLSQLAEDEDFILFYSGHGTELSLEKPLIIDPEKAGAFTVKKVALLLPYDAADENAPEIDRIKQGILTFELVNQLKKSPGRHRLALIDACFSGFTNDPSEFPMKFEEPKGDLRLSERFNHPTVQIVTSSGPSERAREMDQWHGTAFFDVVKASLQEDKTRRTLQLFSDVQEQMWSDKYFIMGKPSADPTMRAFVSSESDFHFIPPSRYGEWQNAAASAAAKHSLIDPNAPFPGSVPGDTDAAGAAGGLEATTEPMAASSINQSHITQTIPDEEVEQVFQALRAADTSTSRTSNPLAALTGQVTAPATPPPAARSAPPANGQAITLPASALAAGITTEKLKHYEARASIGDPKALAILTEIYGRSEDPTERDRAFDMAYAAYETGAPTGKAALASAFTHGYGVDVDKRLGTALAKQSGMEDMLALLGVAIIANVALQNANSDEEKAGAAVVMGAAAVGFFKSFGENPMMDRFSKDPIRQTRYRFNSARKELQKKKPNPKRAQKHFSDLRETLLKATDMPESHLAFLNSRIDMLDEILGADEPDILRAIALIDEVFNPQPSDGDEEEEPSATPPGN